MSTTGSSEGIILIDKPSGMTSHDVVDFIRKRFGYRKVGHAGTLDPMASGLLIILLGRFTKKSAHFLNYNKEYEARLFFGASTDTGDAEGNIIQRK
ncbi:MAG: tRNA pseudouridine(55) synthase, partial [Candidatus Omnitrophota bacterium]